MFLTAATGSETCSADPLGTFLASSGTFGVFDVLLVRGAGLPVVDFATAVRREGRGREAGSAGS